MVALAHPVSAFENCIEEIMSDAHKEHESVIKTPKQLIAAVIAGFLVPIICIVLLVEYVASNPAGGAGSASQTPEAIAARIRPVADAGFTLVDPNAPKQLMAASDVYKSACIACHGTGAAGAPKTGDNAAWSARIAQGYDQLVANAVNGMGAMPAKGGNPDLDNLEVAAAVVFMANQSGANFEAPDMKAAQQTAVAAESATVEPQSQGAVTASATAPITSSPATQAGAAVVPNVDAGKKLYEANCQACHAAGIAGAPKFGDKAAWAPRLEKGAETLYANAIKGFQGETGMMPPKGGSSASDEDVKAAVDYMTAAVK
jgi:cytochrome c5